MAAIEGTIETSKHTMSKSKSLDKVVEGVIQRFEKRVEKDAPITLCELRPGIGLCDGCGLPKWPQEYVGYGIMLCLDCIAKDKK